MSITMGRGDFKAYMANIVNHCDDASFEGLCTIFLTACGVIDKNGELTKEYAESPYWTLEGEVIKPASYEDLMAKLSAGVQSVIKDIAEVQGKTSQRD